MKIGQKVAVCHDGKWGRRVEGEVVATRKGHHIKVRFPNPDTGAPLEFWARKFSHIRHRKSTLTEYGISIFTKRYGKYGGWIDDLDVWMPWYAIYKWVDKK